MCIESDLRAHRTLFDETSPLKRLLSELGVDNKHGVAEALCTAISNARASENIAVHGYAVHERLLVCAGEITFARGEGDSPSVRAVVMENLLRGLAAEESGEAIVAAAESAREEARKLYEKYLKSQRQP